MTALKVLSIAAGGAVAAGAVAAATVPTLRKQFAEAKKVSPEFRAPVLFVPIPLTSQVLALSRRLRTPRNLREGVTSERRTIAAAEDLGGPTDVPDLDVILYETAERTRPAPALLWIHGGGMVIGTPEQGDALSCQVADELEMLVVSVDYRLAPESPYPAATDDCLRALLWLRAHAEELGVDPTRIAVGGDSAGGGLAAVTAQRALDSGVPLAFQLLEYPMLDDRTVLTAERDNRWALVWSPPANRFGWTAYLGHPPREEDDLPYAAAARRVDVSRLAPAWIGVGDLDLFHDEDVDYAERLTEAGVPCELHVEPGMYHGADSFVPDRPAAIAFRQRMIDALREALA